MYIWSELQLKYLSCGIFALLSIILEHSSDPTCQLSFPHPEHSTVVSQEPMDYHEYIMSADSFRAWEALCYPLIENFKALNMYGE